MHFWNSETNLCIDMHHLFLQYQCTKILFLVLLPSNQVQDRLALKYLVLGNVETSRNIKKTTYLVIKSYILWNLSASTKLQMFNLKESERERENINIKRKSWWGEKELSYTYSILHDWMIVIRKPVACNLIYDVLLEFVLFGVVPKHRYVVRPI